jgi:archaellum component FlaC
MEQKNNTDKQLSGIKNALQELQSMLQELTMLVWEVNCSKNINKPFIGI